MRLVTKRQVWGALCPPAPRPIQFEQDWRPIKQNKLAHEQGYEIRNSRARSVVSRYKSLADIERGFRGLKSELEIGPVYHRLPDRIRAHASICFMPLVLYRIMRQRLQAKQTGLSPERTLSLLRRI